METPQKLRNDYDKISLIANHFGCNVVFEEDGFRIIGENYGKALMATYFYHKEGKLSLIKSSEFRVCSNITIYEDDKQESEMKNDVKVFY